MVKGHKAPVRKALRASEPKDLEPISYSILLTCLSLGEPSCFHQRQHIGVPMDFVINHLNPDHVSTTRVSSQAVSSSNIFPTGDL